MSEENSPLKSTRAEQIGEGAVIALNAVPIVGGVLAGIASTIIEKRQNQRLEEFLIDLAENIDAVKGQMNSDFVKGEEFADLAENIFSKASEARQQEKLDALRAIFLNTTLASRPNYDEATEMVELIGNWQKRHIVLLKILSDPYKADEQMNNAVGRDGSSIEEIIGKLLPEWDKSQIERTWKELYDAQIHRTPDTKGMMTNQGIFHLENRLTTFGQRVANYIRLPRTL